MILLDYKDSRPIYEQVADKLQELMIRGVLEEDEQMPSVRSLAMDLSINPNTIQRAYGELERRGCVYSVKGRGSFVGSVKKLKEGRRQELREQMAALASVAGILRIGKEEFCSLAAWAWEKQESGHGSGKREESQEKDHSEIRAETLSGSQPGNYTEGGKDHDQS